MVLKRSAGNDTASPVSKARPATSTLIDLRLTLLQKAKSEQSQEDTVTIIIVPTEVLEEILLDSAIDIKTLLLSQRVCTRFRDTVEGSVKLQRKLMFKPPTTEAEAAATGIDDKTMVISRGPGEVAAVSTCIFHIGSSSQRYQRGPIRAKLQRHIVRDTPSSRREQGSWERMHVQIPIEGWTDCHHRVEMTYVVEKMFRKDDASPTYLREGDRIWYDQVCMWNKPFRAAMDEIEDDLLNGHSGRGVEVLHSWSKAEFEIQGDLMPFGMYKKKNREAQKQSEKYGCFLDDWWDVENCNHKIHGAQEDLSSDESDSGHDELNSNDDGSVSEDELDDVEDREG